MRGKESFLDLLCSFKRAGSFQARYQKYVHLRRPLTHYKQVHLGPTAATRCFPESPWLLAPVVLAAGSTQRTHSFHLLAANQPHTDTHLNAPLCLREHCPVRLSLDLHRVTTRVNTFSVPA